MRMLVQTAPGKLEIQQVACPQPGPGEILMRVHYCGICGTDLMNYRGQYVWGRDSFPKFPGHEASGVVEALGEGVNHFKIGDRILPECTIGCGVCEWCKAGNYSLCRNRMKTSNGAMADYLTVPAKGVLKLPDSLELLEGALIEPVAVGASAALKCGSIFGKSVGVIGAGTIGLGSLETFHVLGAAKSFVFDLAEPRLELAEKLGATRGVNPSRVDPINAVHEATRGAGLDRVVVASAGTAATVGLALKLVAPLGVISIVGLSGGQLSEIDADEISEKEVTVIGSHSSPGVWEDLLACAAAGRYDLKSLVSHILPLEEAERAFQLLDTSSEPAHKVVLSMVEG
ncbi:MAG: hypothetical protein DYH02_09310 [Candidatus Omnitrophica bacterium COP1]|nr:hypothetical protein [Candidatus Omnitrophica bacterium COP1]